ncbi:MAG: OmpA family protein [Acidobacteria bacterium]|nr:OmpA family protein [Acidobacteriota bacterium]
MSKRSIGLIAVLCFAFFAATGCRKKVAVAPPPPPPPAPAKEAPLPPKAPVISQFSADPNTIQRGQSTTLRWSSNDATEASIEPGIGIVPSTGNRQAFPNASTMYTLRVQGPGGTASATAMVMVAAPPPSPPPPVSLPPPTMTLSERLSREVQDAYFDFDKSDIRVDARIALSKNSDALRAIFKDFPEVVIVLEGHCDERGSAEYNLGLGDRRANVTRDFLSGSGLPADRLRVVSYGKERPQCTESNEECWQKNRRVHFAPGSVGPT